MEDVENSLSAQGIRLLPCSTSLPSGMVSPAALEQHKHRRSSPSAGRAASQPLPGEWLVQDGDTAEGHVTFRSAHSSPGTTGGTFPQLGAFLGDARAEGPATSWECISSVGRGSFCCLSTRFPQGLGDLGLSGDSPGLTLRSPGGICAREVTR